MRGPQARSLHHYPRRNPDRMGNWRHHSAPLRLRACRKKNHKTCEDYLADHGSHVTARRAKPGPNNLLHLQRCAQLPIGFNPIPSVPTNLPLSRPQKIHLQAVELISIPAVYYPLLAAHFLLFPLLYSLPLCYNHPAVEHAAKWGLARAQAEPAQAAVQSAVSLQHGQSAAAPSEDPSRYCPVCSQRLESRRCKLICSVCGYYMSCADYY